MFEVFKAFEAFRGIWGIWMNQTVSNCLKMTRKYYVRLTSTIWLFLAYKIIESCVLIDLFMIVVLLWHSLICPLRKQYPRHKTKTSVSEKILFASPSWERWVAQDCMRSWVTWWQRGDDKTWWVMRCKIEGWHDQNGWSITKKNWELQYQGHYLQIGWINLLFLRVKNTSFAPIISPFEMYLLIFLGFNAMRYTVVF